MRPPSTLLIRKIASAICISITLGAGIALAHDTFVPRGGEMSFHVPAWQALARL